MDEQKTKYCDMENGCMFCDRLLCEGKKEEKSNNSLSGQMQGNYGRITSNGDYMIIIKEITAVFTGKDGSMGFKHGQEYKLWFFEKNGRYYIGRRSENATAIPYDTMTALKKNWNF